MFLMMPSFRRVVNENDKKKLANVLFANLKGNTVLKTLSNIKEKAFSYGVDLSDIQTLDLSKNIDFTNEELVKEVQTLHKTFINRILDEVNNDEVTSLLKSNNININKLVYEDREGTDGYFSNKLIETYQHILADPTIIKEVMQSIDSSFFKSAIQSLVTKNKSSSMSLYHMEPKNEIETVYSFRAGKAGVGIEANSMVDINRTGDLFIHKHFTNTFENLKDEFNIKDGTILLDQEFSRPLEEDVVRKFATDMNIKDVDTFVAELKDVKTVSSMVAILNGFVDIAKDPYITQGGWGTASTNFGNTLLRMGVNPLKVITLMMQPAIKAKFSNSMNVEADLLKSLIIKDHPNFSRNLINKFTVADIMVEVNKSEILTDDYKKKVDVSFKRNGLNHSNLLNLDKLVKSIKNFELEDLSEQLNILDFSQSISEINKEIKLNIEVSRADTDGLNGNVSNMHVMNNKIDRLKGSSILGGFESKLKDSPLAVYKDNLTKVFDMTQNNPHLFPEASKTNLAVVDFISNIMFNEDVIDKEILSAINNALYSYKMQQFFKLNNVESLKLLKDFPNEFNEFKDLHKDEYLILKELSVKSVASKNLNGVKGLINLNSRERTGVEKAKISNSWDTMLKDHPEMSKKLIKYAFASTNFNFTSTQFYELIPTSYYIDNDITKFIKSYDNRNIDIIGIANNITKTSVEASKMIPYTSKTDYKTIKGVPHININKLFHPGFQMVKSSNNSLFIASNNVDNIVKLEDGTSYVPVFSINQQETSIDGTNISLFTPFVSSNKNINQAVQSLLNEKKSISSRGIFSKGQNEATDADFEILNIFNSIADGSNSLSDKKTMIESYREKLNRKMNAGDVNILINELLFSDLTLSEIEQELKNCI